MENEMQMLFIQFFSHSIFHFVRFHFQSRSKANANQVAFPNAIKSELHPRLETYSHGINWNPQCAIARIKINVLDFARSRNDLIYFHRT